MARRGAGPRFGSVARRRPAVAHQWPGERADPRPRPAAPLVSHRAGVRRRPRPRRAAWGSGQPGLSGAFELGGPQVLTYEEFLRAIGRATRHPRPLVHVQLQLARAAARMFDLLGSAAPVTSDQLQMLVEGSATPENAAESVFGIRPVPFEEGLRRFL